MTPQLYHYTCGHYAADIDAELVLRPNAHPWLPGLPLVWLTDLDVPALAALGLTSATLACDRTEVRYTVAHAGLCRPWTVLAHALPWELREAFEGDPGVLPRHWWISGLPVPVHPRTGTDMANGRPSVPNRGRTGPAGHPPTPNTAPHREDRP